MPYFIPLSRYQLSFFLKQILNLDIEFICLFSILGYLIYNYKSYKNTCLDYYLLNEVKKELLNEESKY